MSNINILLFFGLLKLFTASNFLLYHLKQSVQKYITLLLFQVAHFVTPFTYDSLQSLHAAMNGLLPPEIRVREISPALSEFHARFSTKSKTYHYKIYNNPIMDPFLSLYAYHSTYKLSPAAMREAAAYFVGKHDFSSFANASHNDRLPDPTKEIFSFDIKEMVFHVKKLIDTIYCLYLQLCCPPLFMCVFKTNFVLTRT